MSSGSGSARAPYCLQKGLPNERLLRLLGFFQALRDIGRQG